MPRMHYLLLVSVQMFSWQLGPQHVGRIGILPHLNFDLATSSAVQGAPCCISDGPRGYTGDVSLLEWSLSRHGLLQLLLCWRILHQHGHLRREPKRHPCWHSDDPLSGPVVAYGVDRESGEVMCKPCGVHVLPLAVDCDMCLVLMIRGVPSLWLLDALCFSLRCVSGPTCGKLNLTFGCKKT